MMSQSVFFLIIVIIFMSNEEAGTVRLKKRLGLGSGKRLKRSSSVTVSAHTNTIITADQFMRVKVRHICDIFE